MADLKAIVGFDHVAQQERERVEFIEKILQTATCLVAVRGDAVLGYGALDYSFYGNGFISILYVAEIARRRGIGSALVKALEAKCKTQKLFTSTNQSNGPMQALLEQLGYEPSGIIHNLDPGDPELVYIR